MVRVLTVIFAFSSVFAASYSFAALGDSPAEVICMYKCGQTVGNLDKCTYICTAPL